MVKKKSILFTISAWMLFCTVFLSCTADEKIIQTPVSDELLSQAREILQDSIVLNAHAMNGTVSKTLLPEGCPLKYYFSWKSQDTLNIQLREFSVGNMPVTIWFSVNVKFMQLNTWEKEEYTGTSWIKFQGINGVTNYMGNPGEDYENGEGGSGSVIGYFNAATDEIEFITNFNVLNMSSDVYQQKIDLSRMEHYEADFAQFEKDLKKYKQEHGL